VKLPDWLTRAASGFEIVAGGSEDAAAIARLLAACMIDPWSEDMVRAAMGLRGASAFVVRGGAGAALVGGVLLHVIGDEAEILQLAVVPERRRGGMGRALLDHAVAAAVRWGARDVYLEVRESNVAARQLYASAGFEHVGRRKRYYNDGEDALVLAMRVAPPPPPSAAPSRDGGRA
jgi:ribosomal-protein-alanine N-acetyltransferase